MRIAFALIGYFIILAAGAVIFPLARVERYRASHPRRWRMFFAAYFALIFTPSILSDFFLWRFPGPATMGLLLIAPSLLSHDDRAAALTLLARYYLLPLLVGFAAFYITLSLYYRRGLRP